MVDMNIFLRSSRELIPATVPDISSSKWKWKLLKRLKGAEYLHWISKSGGEVYIEEFIHQIEHGDDSAYSFIWDTTEKLHSILFLHLIVLGIE